MTRITFAKAREIIDCSADALYDYVRRYPALLGVLPPEAGHSTPTFDETGVRRIASARRSARKVAIDDVSQQATGGSEDVH